MTAEDRLRQALRPVDPGADFADRVLAGLGDPSLPAPGPATRESRGSARAAIAATVLLTLGAGFLVHQQREQQRAAAAQQLTLALAVTSSRLDQAFQHLDFKTREMP